MAIMIRDAEWTKGNPKVETNITLLMRHPEWLGLNQNLPDLAGLEICVMDDPVRPGEAGLVLATSIGLMRAGIDDVSLPENPINRAIQNVAKWHRAAACTWVPRLTMENRSRGRTPGYAPGKPGKRRVR